MYIFYNCSTYDNIIVFQEITQYDINILTTLFLILPTITNVHVLGMRSSFPLALCLQVHLLTWFSTAFPPACDLCESLGVALPTSPVGEPLLHLFHSDISGLGHHLCCCVAGIRVLFILLVPGGHDLDGSLTQPFSATCKADFPGSLHSGNMNGWWCGHLGM